MNANISRIKEMFENGKCKADKIELSLNFLRLTINGKVLVVYSDGIMMLTEEGDYVAHFTSFTEAYKAIGGEQIK